MKIEIENIEELTKVVSDIASGKGDLEELQNLYAKTDSLIYFILILITEEIQDNTIRKDVFQSVFDSVTSPSCIVDNAYQIIHRNELFDQSLESIQTGELKSKRLEDFFTQKTIVKLGKAFELLKTKDVSQLDINGNSIYQNQPVELKISIINDDHSTAEYALSIKSDFTDQNSSDLLTDRESEVLKLIAQGLTDHEIADLFHISSRTVGNHRNNILKKTKARNSIHLVSVALRKGFIRLD